MNFHIFLWPKPSWCLTTTPILAFFFRQPVLRFTNEPNMVPVTGAACPRNSHGVAHKRSLPQAIAPIPDLRSNLSVSAPGFTGIHTLPKKKKKNKTIIHPGSSPLVHRVGFWRQCLALSDDRLFLEIFGFAESPLWIHSHISYDLNAALLHSQSLLLSS